jgi:hypothetical protein
VELDAVTKNMVHDLIKGQENTLDKVAIMKEDNTRTGWSRRHQGWWDIIGIVGSDDV